MGVVHTTASLLSRCRHPSDRDVDPALVDNTHVLPQLNAELKKLWAIIAQVDPDLITAVSAQFTIAAGNTFALAQGGADGVATSAFMGLRGVDFTVDGGAHWKGMRVWRFARRDRVSGLRYRLRDMHTLEILPADFARVYPYRHWYLRQPATLTNGGESIELPVGGDDFVIQGVNAFVVKPRFEEDPTPHFAAQAAAEANVRRFLAIGQGEREPIMPATDTDDGDDW